MILFVILLVYLSLPDDTLNVLLTTESKLLHEFIEYESKFGDLNSYNNGHHLPKTLGMATINHDTLILSLAHTSRNLTISLKEVRTSYPFTRPLVNRILSWKKNNEQKIIGGKYLLYWQVSLLHYQIQLINVLNNKESKNNFTTTQLISKYQNKLKGIDREKICKLTLKLSGINDPRKLAERIAAENLTEGSCGENPNNKSHLEGKNHDNP